MSLPCVSPTVARAKSPRVSRLNSCSDVDYNCARRIAPSPFSRTLKKRIPYFLPFLDFWRAKAERPSRGVPRISLSVVRPCRIWGDILNTLLSYPRNPKPSGPSCHDGSVSFSDLGCYKKVVVYGCCCCCGVFFFPPFFFSFLFSTFFSLRKTRVKRPPCSSFLPSFFLFFFFSQDKTTKSKKRKHKIVRVKQPPRVITPCEDQTSGQRLNLHRKQLKWRHTWEASPNRRTR